MVVLGVAVEVLTFLGTKFIIPGVVSLAKSPQAIAAYHYLYSQIYDTLNDKMKKILLKSFENFKNIDKNNLIKMIFKNDIKQPFESLINITNYNTIRYNEIISNKNNQIIIYEKINIFNNLDDKKKIFNDEFTNNFLKYLIRNVNDIYIYRIDDKNNSNNIFFYIKYIIDSNNSIIKKFSYENIKKSIDNIKLFLNNDNMIKIYYFFKNYFTCYLHNNFILYNNNRNLKLDYLIVSQDIVDFKDIYKNLNDNQDAIINSLFNYKSNYFKYIINLINKYNISSTIKDFSNIMTGGEKNSYSLRKDFLIEILDKIKSPIIINYNINNDLPNISLNFLGLVNKNIDEIDILIVENSKIDSITSLLYYYILDILNLESSKKINEKNKNIINILKTFYNNDIFKDYAMQKNNNFIKTTKKELAKLIKSNNIMRSIQSSSFSLKKTIDFNEIIENFKNEENKLFLNQIYEKLNLKTIIDHCIEHNKKSSINIISYSENFININKDYTYNIYIKISKNEYKYNYNHNIDGYNDLFMSSIIYNYINDNIKNILLKNFKIFINNNNNLKSLINDNCDIMFIMNSKNMYLSIKKDNKEILLDCIFIYKLFIFPINLLQEYFSIKDYNLLYFFKNLNVKFTDFESLKKLYEIYYNTIIELININKINKNTIKINIINKITKADDIVNIKKNFLYGFLNICTRDFYNFYQENRIYIKIKSIEFYLQISDNKIYIYIYKKKDFFHKERSITIELNEFKKFYMNYNLYTKKDNIFKIYNYLFTEISQKFINIRELGVIQKELGVIKNKSNNLDIIKKGIENFFILKWILRYNSIIKLYSTNTNTKIILNNTKIKLLYDNINKIPDKEKTIISNNSDPKKNLHDKIYYNFNKEPNKKEISNSKLKVELENKNQVTKYIDDDNNIYYFTISDTKLVVNVIKNKRLDTYNINNNKNKKNNIEKCEYLTKYFEHNNYNIFRNIICNLLNEKNSTILKIVLNKNKSSNNIFINIYYKKKNKLITSVYFTYNPLLKMNNKLTININKFNQLIKLLNKNSKKVYTFEDIKRLMKNKKNNKNVKNLTING